MSLWEPLKTHYECLGFLEVPLYLSVLIISMKIENEA